MSRLQKLHNVSLILNALYKGADVRPNPKQIVDGQRDVTLALLWRLLYEFELRMLIQPDRVLEEVQTIRRSRFHFMKGIFICDIGLTTTCIFRSWRRSIYSRSEAEQFSVRVLLYDDVDLTQQGDDKSNQVKAIMKTHTMDEASMEDMQDLANLTSAKEDVKLSAALMRWVRAICEQYQVSRDFHRHFALNNFLGSRCIIRRYQSLISLHAWRMVELCACLFITTTLPYCPRAGR